MEPLWIETRPRVRKLHADQTQNVLPNENSSTIRAILFIVVFVFLDQLTSLRDTTSPEKQHCFDRSSPPIIEEVVAILISVNYTVIEPGVSLKNNMVLQRALS